MAPPAFFANARSARGGVIYCARRELCEALDSAGAQYMSPTGRDRPMFRIDFHARVLRSKPSLARQDPSLARPSMGRSNCTRPLEER